MDAISPNYVTWRPGYDSMGGIKFAKVANHVVSMIGLTDFLNQSNHS